jgi:hypothetical protein
MRILKALPIVSALSLAATIGCVHDKGATNDTSTPAYSGTENSTRLTPTSDRPSEPHIYSNATSRAVSPALDPSTGGPSETP